MIVSVWPSARALVMVTANAREVGAMFAAELPPTVTEVHPMELVVKNPV